MKYKLTDKIYYGDSCMIIFDKKCVDFLPEYDKPLPTFGDILDVARKNGYDSCGTVLLISETGLDGKIYKYGNHGDFWEDYGTTIGYA